MGKRGEEVVRIAISGKSGCGNSSVSKIVAERLGIRLINYTFHDMAREMNIPFEELCRLAERDPRYDLELDKRLVELAMEGSCVLGSRLAVWLLEEADLKVYLTASLEERARRIAKREGLNFEDSYRATKQRDERDRLRYLKLYNIDVDKFDFVDLIIDTEKGDQYYVADRIIAALSLQ